MSYDERVVFFLDILGFKNIIQSTINSDGSDNSNNIKNIHGMIDNFHYFIGVDRGQDSGDMMATQFSDSVVMSFPINKESGVYRSIHNILLLQITLVLFYGVLLRGGVSKGRLIHNDKELYGPALIDAYTLESKAALYPRVILDESIIDAGCSAHGTHHHSSHEREAILEIVSPDFDGMYFIDYIKNANSTSADVDLPKYLSRIRDIVAREISNPDLSIRIKFQWLKEKYLTYLDEVKLSAKDTLRNEELYQRYCAIPDI